jgi:hypothetical protein
MYRTMPRAVEATNAGQAWPFALNVRQRRMPVSVG